MNLTTKKWKGLFNHKGSNLHTPRLVREQLEHKRTKKRGLQGSKRVSPPTSPSITVSPETPCTPKSKLPLNGNVAILSLNEIMNLMDEVAEEIDHQLSRYYMLVICDSNGIMGYVIMTDRYDSDINGDPSVIPKKNQVKDIRSIFQYGTYFTDTPPLCTIWYMNPRRIFCDSLSETVGVRGYFTSPASAS